VVNFELPHVAEDYVHRIGRTGRAGSEGEALSLVCVDEHLLLRNIERLLKSKITEIRLPSFEPDPRIKPEPIPNGRGSAPANRGDRRGISNNGERRGGAGLLRNGHSGAARSEERRAEYPYHRKNYR
jgi:ATP-dependent RNA helicase RhlE